VLNPPKARLSAVDIRRHAGLNRRLTVPATCVCETADAALEAFERLGGDVVVKPLFGSEGRGIVRVSDPDLALRTFRTLERIQAVLYVQKFIEHEGFDVRVLVLDGRVVGSIRRRSPHDFRTNVSRAAVAELHESTEQERDWALRAAEATGTRFAGVDLLWRQPAIVRD
jgi:ribosomal protein S6--L-glutamate ligase